MSETSLHTKYRPRTWKDVYGQDDVVAALKQIVKNNRAHSFIFTGPSGSGKTTLARILGMKLAGEGASSANLVEVDAATNTGVEAVKAIAARSHYRATGASPVKVNIIDEAHRLSGQAWDSLLKAIEEPPAHVYWMFCTTVPGKIPKTIQTRCVSLVLKEVPEDDLVVLLKHVVTEEKLEVDDEVLEAIAESSGGSPRQALVFLEACQYAENASDARKMMRAAGVASKEVIDLCRWMIQGRGLDWAGATKLLKPILAGTDPESIRIVVSNYFATALLGTTKEAEAVRLLTILEAFDTPYNQTDKAAPLLLSVARAIGLGDG